MLRGCYCVIVNNLSFKSQLSRVCTVGDRAKETKEVRVGTISVADTRVAFQSPTCPTVNSRPSGVFVGLEG